MDSQGFDFRKKAERREPRAFEPPPWEKEAFARIQGEREEERPADESTAEGQPQVQPAVAEERQAVSVPPVGTVPTRPQVSEAEMLELLAALSASEPDLGRTVVGVTMVSALLLFGVGIVLMVWGIAAVMKPGSGTVGAVGGGGLLIFGAGFIASACWVVYRMLKQRGVL